MIEPERHRATLKESILPKAEFLRKGVNTQMATVKKEMLISEVIRIDRGLVPILMNHGMNCVGCPSAQHESLEQAAVVHGMDADALVEEMNVFLQNQGTVSEL